MSEPSSEYQAVKTPTPFQDREVSIEIIKLATEAAVRMIETLCPLSVLRTRAVQKVWDGQNLAVEALNSSLPDTGRRSTPPAGMGYTGGAD